MKCPGCGEGFTRVELEDPSLHTTVQDHISIWHPECWNFFVEAMS